MKKRKQPIKRNRTIWQQFQGDDLFKKKTHKNYYKKIDKFNNLYCQYKYVYVLYKKNWNCQQQITNICTRLIFKKLSLAYFIFKKKNAKQILSYASNVMCFLELKNCSDILFLRPFFGQTDREREKKEISICTHCWCRARF